MKRELPAYRDGRSISRAFFKKDMLHRAWEWMSKGSSKVGRALPLVLRDDWIFLLDGQCNIRNLLESVQMGSLFGSKTAIATQTSNRTLHLPKRITFKT